MKTNNNTIIIGLLTLVVGLLAGYLLGASTLFHQSSFNDNHAHHNQAASHEHGSHDGFGMGGMMHGMMFSASDQSVEEFEETWLQQMIIHHEGAVQMSEELLERTDRPELIDFAEEIINAQSEEVETMETWLNNWFN